MGYCEEAVNGACERTLQEVVLHLQPLRRNSLLIFANITKMYGCIIITISKCGMFTGLFDAYD